MDNMNDTINQDTITLTVNDPSVCGSCGGPVNPDCYNYDYDKVCTLTPDTSINSQQLNKYMVETVSIFRIRYVVEAKNKEHATDEVTIGVGDHKFKEFSQLHVDEVISSCREITDDEYLRIFDEDNNYLKEWTKEQKLDFINKIDYDDSEIKSWGL